MTASLLPPAADPPTDLPPAQVAKLRRTAQDFEAMALGEFLKPMFDTVDLSKTMFGGGSGEETWKPMLISAMARQIAAAGGIGIAGPVFREMLHQQEGRTLAPTNPALGAPGS